MLSLSSSLYLLLLLSSSSSNSPISFKCCIFFNNFKANSRCILLVKPSFSLRSILVSDLLNSKTLTKSEQKFSDMLLFLRSMLLKYTSFVKANTNSLASLSEKLLWLRIISLRPFLYSLSGGSSPLRLYDHTI